MRYKDLVMDKIEKVENFFGALELHISRGDQTSYNATMEKIKSLLGDIRRFVDVEKQD